MAVVGFDFGTTNSLISMVDGGRLIRFMDDHGLPVPSVVCYEGNQTIVGRSARERLAQAGLGVQGNVVRSPKTSLGKESVFVGGVERKPVDIVRDVVSYVREQALASRIVKNLIIDRAVVTIPVTMQGYRRALLRDAFRMAGISIVQFVHEPLAALYGHLRSGTNLEATLRRYDRQLVLVFDWGGGTLDLTVCRIVDGVLVQVGNDGTDDVGGDRFDDEIKNAIEARVRDKRGLSEEVTLQAEAHARLLHVCEKAKIDLSGRRDAVVYVPNFFKGLEDNSLDFNLSRDELEQMVAHLVQKGIARITQLLSREEYSTSSIALCLATGGMANMPVVKSRLHELFGPERVHVPANSASLISEGAAWVAHDDAQQLLAKNIELVLARNSFMPLLTAGLKMPKEGEIQNQEFSLYCVDPSDGFGKFQLQSPLRPGPNVLLSDTRRCLANLVIPVDKMAMPFRERLQLNIEIDDNLVLTAKARSLNVSGLAEAEVHDLEFALALPTGHSGWLGREPFDLVGKSDPESETGGLAMRSNVAANEDLALVPGEVLYAINPAYFRLDQRWLPPQEQIDEYLYYKPCSICKRVSNDPLCRCATVPFVQPISIQSPGSASQ